MRSLLALSLALVACNPPPAAAPTPGAIADAGELVFTVNGTPVGNKELELVYKRMKIPPSQIETFAKSKGGQHVAEEYAAATALYQKAVEAKLWEDPEVQLEIAFATRQVLGARMRDKLAKAAVSDQAIQDWYQQNKARFDKPEVRARQILVGTESLANDLAARLLAGEDFAKLAKDHSTDRASAERGGDVGWFQQHENPLFGEQAFAANKGDRLPPIQSRLGWHVVEVTDKRDSTPMDEVRPEAEAQLMHAEATRQIDEIRKNLKIEWVNPPAEEPAAPGGAAPGGMPAGHPPAGGMPPGHPPAGGAPAPGEAPAPGGAPAPGAGGH